MMSKTSDCREGDLFAFSGTSFLKTYLWQCFRAKPLLAESSLFIEYMPHLCLTICATFENEFPKKRFGDMCMLNLSSKHVEAKEQASPVEPEAIFRFFSPNK